MDLRAPDYSGLGLVNLIAELEMRLLGTAPMPGLAEADSMPSAPGYVLAIFDGIGSHQLAHDAAAPLLAARAGVLRAGFPTTTTTSLATVATGLPPAGHGVIGHTMHLPGVAEVANVLKWVTPEGRPVPHDYSAMLPFPNLFERLRTGGVEPITVQPGPFVGSPLSQMLYRGCRFEPAWSVEELAQATVQLAGPGRLVIVYFPNVDVAAHVTGQASRAYAEALGEAAGLWESLELRLNDDVALVGTSDHGHLDYDQAGKVLIRDRRYDRLRFFGDSRATYVTGPVELVVELAAETGAEMVEANQLRTWLGPGPLHPDLMSRLPDHTLLAPAGRLLLPRGFDKRLVGYHGGLTAAEMEIPLLVRA